MDPDYDIHLSDENEFAADAAAADMAKSHFLDSIGIRDLVEDPGKTGFEEEAGTSDGVVLSSMPDDLGFPTAESSPRGWDGPGPDLATAPRLAPEAITLPEEEETRPRPEPSSEPSLEDSGAAAEADPEEVLNLHCPSCEGSLVLKRRHLGIEGACVWCQTPIVAVESPMDRSVRIFPISSKAPQKTAPEPDKPTTIAASPAEPAQEASTTLVEADLTGPAAEDATADEAFGSGFSSWTAPPSQEGEEGPAAAEITAMPDLEALYETSGFLAPSIPPADAAILPTGFGEALGSPAKAVEETETEVAIPSGFGAFLQNPSSEPKAEPSSDFGFAAPVPWGPPAKQPLAEAPAPTVADKEEAPKALEAGASSEFSAAWGASTDAGPREDASDGFGAAFAAVASSAVPAVAPPSEFSFAGFAEQEKPTEFAPDDSERAYVAPLHGFSTGSSKEEEPIAMESGFAGLTSSPLSWSQTQDEAPAALEPIADETRLAPVEEADSAPTPFGNPPAEGIGPFGGVRSELTASPFALPQSQPAPPLETAVAQTAPPPIPPAPLSPETSPLNLPLGPQVVSQPLGAKEKPKIRKGFLVLMVVIVGFASGAALASFVLPVEEYVASARAFMEKKFNPGAAALQMPDLPSLVGSQEAAAAVQP